MIWAAMTLIWRHHEVDFCFDYLTASLKQSDEISGNLVRLYMSEWNRKDMYAGFAEPPYKCNTETLIRVPRFPFCSHWWRRGCPKDNLGAAKDNIATTDLIESMCHFNNSVISILEYVK